MQARLSLLFLTVLFSLPLSAEDSDQPSLELLEFLGEWEDGQGNWIDPHTLALSVPADEETENDTGTKQDND